MRFLALSPIAAASLLAGVALAILLPALPALTTARHPSVLLWARIERSQAPARAPLLSLLLALGWASWRAGPHPAGDRGLGPTGASSGLVLDNCLRWPRG
jgi:hypothetical protein